MRQIADRLYLETSYPGVNVMAASTRKGVVCIDTPTFPRDARIWAARVHKLHPYVLDFLILTDAHGDRILNTRWFSTPIITQHHTESRLQQFDKRYPQSLLDSLVARNPDFGRDLLPGPVEQPAMSFSEKLTLGNGNLRMDLYHMPGPNPGTVWVHFPQAGILFASDSVVNGEFPCLVQANIQAWLNSLEMLQHDQRFAGVHSIVPGRGEVCDRKSLDPLVKYLQDVQDCVQKHVDAGRTREELSCYVSELVIRFPDDPWPRNWTQKQIKTGLEHLYDQIQLSTPVGVN